MEAAEDLAQETLLRAFRYLHRVDPSRPMWPWLRAIALNRAATWAGRQPCVAPLDGVELAAEADDLAQIESRQAVRALIGELPPAQQRALWLRYVEDQDARRGAATLGVSVAAFKQLLHRARNRLRATGEAGSSILAPALVPWRALRRMLARTGRHPSDTQRLAEALVPVGAAAVALFLVIGGTTITPAGAGPARDRPPVSLTPAGGHVDPDGPADVPRRPATAGAVMAAGTEPPAVPRPNRTCAGAGVQACTSTTPLPHAPSPGMGANRRIPPVIDADVALLDDVCPTIDCVVNDLGPPGVGPDVAGGSPGRILPR